MRQHLLVFAALLALAAVASAATWNPVGTVRPTLKINALGRGDCGVGSESIGSFGYRCGAKNLIVDPCWRDGPAPTELVVCTRSPWAKTAWTIRVPHLLVTAGVTFATPVDPSRDPPWALELADGKRCVRSHGAVDSVRTKHGWLQVAYACDRGRVVLLRNLRRGRLWRIGAAKWTGRRYQLLGNLVVRRAIFPSLPPAMERQNRLAREAVVGSGLLARVLWERMNFPALDWAFVVALARTTSNKITVWRVVHRRGNHWRIVHVRRPVCRSRQVPARARHQLFGCGLPR